MSNTIAALLLTTAIAWAPVQAVDFRDASDTRPTLEVVSYIAPPFAFKRNGSKLGPMVDIVEAVCARANIKCTITMGAFKDIYARAIEGSADVFMPYYLEGGKEREALFWGSPPIIKTNFAFFTSSTSNWTWTGDYKELHGRTIGVFGPSGTQAVAERVANLNFSSKLAIEESNLQVLQQLIVGKYGEKSAIVINKDIAFALLQSSNIYGPRFAGDIEAGNYGIGFSRKSPKLELGERFMNAIITLKEDGTVRAILDKAETKLEPAP